MGLDLKQLYSEHPALVIGAGGGLVLAAGFLLFGNKGNGNQVIPFPPSGWIGNWLEQSGTNIGVGGRGVPHPSPSPHPGPVPSPGPIYDPPPSHTCQPGYWWNPLFQSCEPTNLWKWGPSPGPEPDPGPPGVPAPGPGAPGGHGGFGQLHTGYFFAPSDTSYNAQVASAKQNMSLRF